MVEKFIFATNNKHKLREIQELLGQKFILLSLSDIGFEGDIPETKPTIEENAIQKARYIYDRFKIPCFADDTGLEVEALNGEPGVLSARYAGKNDHSISEESRTEANILKLLNNLSGKLNRKARFRTVIALIEDNNEFIFEGIVEGKIIEQKRGNAGFGYDPVFIPAGFDITFAEMSSEEKNKISHRARAFKKFVEFLTKHI